MRFKTSHKYAVANPLGVNPYTKRSRDYDWKFWAIKTWGRYLNPKNTNDVWITCMYPGCSQVRGLVADHVIPRSNFRVDPWNPCNSQILCWIHNSEKGSEHGPQWDFRPWKYKVFQRYMRRRDWTRDPFEGWKPNHPKKGSKPL